MTKFIKKYYWKELSPDGLLKDPPEVGPYYATAELDCEGYHSEESALADLQEYSRVNSPCRTELVLITVYDNIEEW